MNKQKITRNASEKPVLSRSPCAFKSDYNISRDSYELRPKIQDNSKFFRGEYYCAG